MHIIVQYYSIPPSQPPAPLLPTILRNIFFPTTPFIAIQYIGNISCCKGQLPPYPSCSSRVQPTQHAARTATHATPPSKPSKPVCACTRVCCGAAKSLHTYTHIISYKPYYSITYPLALSKKKAGGKGSPAQYQ